MNVQVSQPATRSPRSTRTRVGIIGAGPAGLMLGHLLARYGIDAVVLENRDREYVEQRQRAGVLEHDVAELLREVGLGERMDALGMQDDGIIVQFDGERHRVDCVSLVGRRMQIWPQTEVVKDLVAARLAAGLPLEFEVSDVALHDVTGDAPRITYTDADGVAQELVCDVIAGCDGFHGPSRQAIPEAVRTVSERAYPFAWLGIIADVPPSTEEMLYARHDDGFALHSMRGRSLSRLYLQVAPEERLEDWSDARIWDGLQTRFALPGWTLAEGPVLQKSIAPMRSYVCEPMRHGRLFLAGDSAHIVPPTGAKGLNLAVADVVELTGALVEWLRDGNEGRAKGYSATCLDRIWRTQIFSWSMTSLTHVPPGQDSFAAQLQKAALRQMMTSPGGMRMLADSYTGMPLPVLPQA